MRCRDPRRSGVAVPRGAAAGAGALGAGRQWQRQRPLRRGRAGGPHRNPAGMPRTARRSRAWARAHLLRPRDATGARRHGTAAGGRHGGRRPTGNPVCGALAGAEGRTVRELRHLQRQRHPTRLLPAIRAPLRRRCPDEEVAPRRGLGSRPAGPGRVGRGAVREARRGHQLLCAAAQLPRRRHLGDQRRRARRADPSRDAALVRLDASAHAARADEAAGPQAGRGVVGDPRRPTGGRAHLDGAVRAGGLRTRRLCATTSACSTATER